MVRLLPIHWGENIQLDIRKISRSNASDEMVAAGLMSEQGRAGNVFADKLTEMGAELFQYGEGTASESKKLWDAKYIQ